MVFHPEVLVEVQEAYEWYYIQSEYLAEEFLKELDKAFVLIEQMPQTWSVLPDGFKRYLLKRFPYGVIYKPEKHKTYILAVMHLNRKPGYWKKRV